MKKKKIVISFSGIDSAGKSTQIDALQKYCENKYSKVRVKWSKARATPGVLFLKSLFRRDRKLNYEEKKAYRNEVFASKKKKTLLLFASIIDLWFYWGIYFRYLRAKNDVLILDRYLWDTYVEVKTDFEGVDFERWLIWKILVKLAMPVKHSVILTVPLEVSLARDIQKTDMTVPEPAAIDSRERKIKKIESYFSLIEQGKWAIVVDGTQTIPEVTKEVIGYFDSISNGN